MQTAKKNKSRLPTEEEFLRFIPFRAEYEWSSSREGFVEIKVPKFTSKLGKSFCKVIKKENIFTAKMDKMGSIVWNNCDGKKTVKDILELIKKEFPDEKNINQRLYLFIQQMRNLNYLYY